MPQVDAELTFGLELEVVKLTDEAAELINRHGFQRRYDRTIRGHRNEELPDSIDCGGGCEVITKPIAVGIKCNQDGNHMQIDYRGADQIVRDLCKCAKEVNTSCGLHVHLGRPVSSAELGPFGVRPSKWEPERVRAMLAVATMIEPKLFDVCPDSRKNNRYCLPIARSYPEKDLTSYYPVGEVVARKYDNQKRYCWLNLIETQRKGSDPRVGRGAGPATGTIEIRMMGNVRRFNYIWAWTQLWLKIAAYVAYVPSSLALMHCVIGDSLKTEFELLARLKEEGKQKIVKQDESGKTIIRPDNAILSTPDEETIHDEGNDEGNNERFDEEPATASTAEDREEPATASTAEIQYIFGNGNNRL